jgi:hypothetical protein
MAGIITKDSRTQRTMDFKSKNLYIGAGRTTSWTDENNPPLPDTNSSEIEELEFIKKVSVLKFVVQDDINGTIVYRDTKWREIQEADIYTESCYHLFIQVDFDYDNLPLITYRQIGIIESPIEIDGVSECTQISYVNTEISSQGILHYLDNRYPTVRQLDNMERISIIIEF